MRDDHVPPGLDHVGDSLHSRGRRFVLIWDSLVVTIPDQCVATNSDDCELLLSSHIRLLARAILPAAWLPARLPLA
jgi:hypothetical protein